MTVNEVAKLMQQHYFETGTYKPEHLYFVLGDPRIGVGSLVKK